MQNDDATMKCELFDLASVPFHALPSICFVSSKRPLCKRHVPDSLVTWTVHVDDDIDIMQVYCAQVE